MIITHTLEDAVKRVELIAGRSLPPVAVAAALR